MSKLSPAESSIATAGADRGIVLDRYTKLDSLAVFIALLNGEYLVVPRTGSRRR
jgi:hypothetical protein